MKYFGNELDAFVPSDSSVIEVNTQYDPTYCRCSISVPTGSSAKSVTFSPETAMWFHFDNYMNSFNSGVVTIFSIYDDVGVEVFRINAIKFYPGLTNTTYSMFYLSGLPSTFTLIGPSVVTNSSLQTIDLFVDQPNGIARLYAAGSLQASGTASMTEVTNFAQVSHRGGRDGDSCYWSQCFGDTVSTVGRRLKTIVEDTNGAEQDFTGAVTDINELVLNDGTGIAAAANGDISTYYKTGLALSGNILGMGTSARFNIGTTGPQNIQNVIRVGGNNYNSPSVLGDAGFQVAQYMWLGNPDAGDISWTTIAAEAIEWGAEAKT